MHAASHDQLKRMATRERLRTIRNWFAVAGVVVFVLAVGSVSNSVVNPETWSSAYHALAASGAFVGYVGWLAAVGSLLLVIAAVIAIYLRRSGEL
jgi:TRAP-type C4-dicarboxylate transport system permease small subunit